MTTAADLIAALNQRRLLKTGKSPEEGVGYPSGWQSWLDAMRPVEGAPKRPDSRDWVTALDAPPLEQPKGLRGKVRPFFQLLRLSRPEDPRDERPLRIGATTADIVLHLILAALLLWLMYSQLFAIAEPEEEAGGGSDAVQVEFIGRGNVQEGGGALATEGAQAAPAAASAAASGKPTANQAAPAAAAAAASARPELNTVPVPTPPAVAASQAPQRVEVAPMLEVVPAQPLQVSEVPKPQPETFRLPPPRELSVPMPQQTPREVQLQAQVEAITTLQAQPIRQLEVRQAQPQLRPQQLRETVREIEVLAPPSTQLARERALPASASGQAQLRVPALTGEIRGIPSGAGPGGSSTASGSGAAALGNSAARGAGGNASTAGGSGQAQAGSGHGAAPGTQGGRGASATGAGAGPGARAAAGGWPGAARSDDWGASNRNAPGTGSGNGNAGRGGQGDRGSGTGDGRGAGDLFNDDGRVRLPDQWSANSDVDLDRSGTWLKRRGLEYRGTRFDRYWIPSGTLLQEWVRRGVKELSIPIPGTGMSLKCVVSLLQLGGGCRPFNPDVNEQPATGRPAPVIPFKPELQEDNGSVRPPPAPAATTPPPKPATPAAPAAATPASTPPNPAPAATAPAAPSPAPAGG